MSSNYMISDLSLENKDPIQRLGRNALLQFVTLDYIILRAYESLAREILTKPPTKIQNIEFNNPYQLDGLLLQYLACNCHPCKAPYVPSTLSSFTQPNENIRNRINQLMSEKMSSEDEIKGLLAGLVKEKKDIQPETVKKIVTYLICSDPDRFVNIATGKAKVMDDLKSFLISKLKESPFSSEFAQIQGKTLNGKKFEDWVAEALSQFVSDDVLLSGPSSTSLKLIDTSIFYTLDADKSFRDLLEEAESNALSNVKTKSKDIGVVLDLTPSKDLPQPSSGTDDSASKMTICDVYRIYIIALTLQRLWSYAFVSTRRIYDFKVEQQIAELQRASNSYGTEDKPNDDSSSYFIASLKSSILEALRESNLGIPIREEVEDILVEVTLHIGFLLSKHKERMDIDAEGDITEEKNEEDLLSTLFPSQRPFPTSAPTPILSDLLEKSGLAPVFGIVHKFLPAGILSLVNSDILNKLVSIWATLFTDMQPEIIDLLASLIPTIPDRFRSSLTISDEQQVFRDGSLKFVEKFLEESIMPIRLTDLQDVLDNTSANSALYYFRSLRILVNKRSGIDPTQTSYEMPWNNFHNNVESVDKGFRRARLNFVRLMHWVLSDQKELGELFAYAQDTWKDTEENNEFFKLSTTKFRGLVSSAIFPGTLETSDVLPRGGMLIDMNYQRQQKNKLILQTRLARVGGVEAALKDMKVRWMP